MIVRRVGPLSLAKILGALYGVIGLIIGAFVALFSILGAGVAASQPDAGMSWMGPLFGVGGIVLFPIVYGVMGFIGGLLTALIYNLVAGVTGGIELEVE